MLSPTKVFGPIAFGEFMGFISTSLNTYITSCLVAAGACKCSNDWLSSASNMARVALRSTEPFTAERQDDIFACQICDPQPIADEGC